MSVAVGVLCAVQLEYDAGETHKSFSNRRNP